MANPTGKGGFTKGHTYSTNKGRPRSLTTIIRSKNLSLALEMGEEALPDILKQLYDGARKGDRKLIELSLDVLVPRPKHDIIELSVDADVDLSVENLKKMKSDDLYRLLAHYIKKKEGKSCPSL